MRFRKKIRKFFQLIKNLLRILWVVIFIHWIIWATTYARAPRYHEALKDEKITHHSEKSQQYRGKGWLGKLVEKKSDEATISEIEEDIIGQIEAQTGQKNLPREWNQHSSELETLDNEIETLKKKDNLSSDEQKELSQKKGPHNN